MASVVRELRDLVPIRSLTPTEALRFAELQANRLLELSDCLAPPVHSRIITEIPRLQVERVTPNFASGATQWSNGRWLIVLSGSEGTARQRFTLAHEFKHVLDHPFIAVLYPDVRGVPSDDRAERVCNYFAACLLMPRQWLHASFHDEGVQEIRALARIFGVSVAAMQVRLVQLGMASWPSPHRVDDSLFESRATAARRSITPS